MSILNKKILLGLYMAILWVGTTLFSIPVQAEKTHDKEIERAGLCTEPRFDEGKLGNTTILRVLNQDAPAYKNPNDTSPSNQLNFGDVLAIYDDNFYENERIRVKSFHTGDDVGWVKREDMLCGNKARTAENGLTARIFVRTDDITYSNDEDRLQGLEVSQRYDGMKCGDECQKLSRFTGYFVFAKKQVSDCQRTEELLCSKFLIANKLELTGSDVLVGWIGSDNAFEWNNGYGLRGSESLAKKDGFICGYRTLEEAKKDTKENCYAKMAGGTAWYERENRMLMLDKISDEKGNNIYKVIAPLRKDGFVDISKEKTKAIGDLRRLDIMFVIDGTHSMTPSMDAVKRTMNKLVGGLPTGVQYRYAFQVYRDAYAEDKNLGDYHNLPDSCDINEDTLNEERDKFIKKLEESVKTTTNDTTSPRPDKDPEENLFGGMNQAIMHLRGNCPEHTKILFVIGDTGYSGLNQKSYGQPELKIEPLVDYLKGEAKLSDSESGNTEQGTTKPIVPFFLQAENKDPGNERYENAYNLFTRQANSFVDAILADVRQRFTKLNIEQKIENQDYVYLINDNMLVDRITETLKQIAKPTLFSEYETRKENGESTDEAIRNMVGDPRYGNTLGVVYDQIILSECSSVSECKEQKVDVIREFYIRESPDLAMDIWMQPDRFAVFVNDMNDVKKTLAEVKNRDDKREAIKTVLTRLFDAKLNYSAAEHWPDSTIAELYRKLNIAVPEDSPLFNIKFKDFNELEQCVIENMSHWISSYTVFMKLIADEDRSLPICGTTTGVNIQDETGKDVGKLGLKTVDDAVSYFPPLCGRSTDELESIRKLIAEECPVGAKMQQLNNLVTLKTPIGSSFLLPPTMSIKYCSGICEENAPPNMMWIPKIMLP
ncbi:VWA domain-containing protein [bacterium]|nr:VWA domain-containing protein [bacterium]